MKHLTAPQMRRFNGATNRVVLLLTMIVLVSSVCLQAQATTGGAIRGVVKNALGLVLPEATITLMNSGGKAVRSTNAASDGTYRITSIPGATYNIRADCDGYLGGVREGVVIGPSRQEVLNFILKPAGGSSGNSQVQTALGPASLYENSEFKAGQVKGPAAAGGYSNSASVRSGEMVRQYLSTSVPAASATGGGRDAGTNLNSGEARFEKSGASLLARRDYPGAARLFQHAVLRYPDSASLRLGLGIALYGQGHYGAAVRALCEAARLGPDNPRPYALLSEADQFSAHPQPCAAASVRRFAQAHPHNAEAHYAYGMVLWRQFRASPGAGTQVLAQSELEKAVTLDPGLAAAHFRLGVVYDREALRDRAIAEYRKTVQLNPDDATAYYRLAQDYTRLGMKKEASSELQAYEKLRVERVRPMP